VRGGGTLYVFGIQMQGVCGGNLPYFGRIFLKLNYIHIE
jgi:hypothetical protein